MNRNNTFIYCLSVTLVLLLSGPTCAAEYSENSDQPCRENRECFYNLIRLNDLDDVLLQDKYGRSIRMELAGILPYAKWPEDKKDTARIFIQQGRDFLVQLLSRDKVFLTPLNPIIEKQGYTTGFLYLYPPLNSFRWQWEGKRPSEQSAWGGFNLNALMVEKGLTVATFKSGKAGNSTLEHVAATLLDAEKYAIKNNRGIWRDKTLSTALRGAANRY